ncbi:CRE-TTX-3 protein [Caenorhabditis remanei]|uniref:CRE-TTX-3 protein n=1 Tax=Caenorhabditis remanei TaxID=31234 RepID=E3NAT2_CAERE|nr:CRE-TTX-3 protein [Caenorhabditis remanei]
MSCSQPKVENIERMGDLIGLILQYSDPKSLSEFMELSAIHTVELYLKSLILPYFAYWLPPMDTHSIDKSESIYQILRFYLMLTNSATKEILTTHVVPETALFQFTWGTKFREEYELVERISSPQYVNLTSTSPSSTSSDPKLSILQQIQVPEPKSVVINQCAHCHFAIYDKDISVLDDKNYHHNCIRCSMCDAPFEYTEKCYVHDGVVYCHDDHAKRYRKCCRKCELPLKREDMIMKAKEMIFHHACFVCFICGTKLNTGDYYTMSPSGHLYCHAHYDVIRTSALCDEPTPPVVVAAPLSPPKTTPPPVVKKEATPAPPAAEKPAREPSTEGEASTDEDGSNGSNQRSKRMRTSFKHHQLRAMKTYFALNHNPDAKDLKQLAAKTNLTKRVLQVWFQNARAKYRRGLQDGGRSSPLCIAGALSTMDMNPPLSIRSTDVYQLNTPPLSTEVYSPNNNYTHL